MDCHNIRHNFLGSVKFSISMKFITVVGEKHKEWCRDGSLVGRFVTFVSPITLSTPLHLMFEIGSPDPQSL